MMIILVIKLCMCEDVILVIKGIGIGCGVCGEYLKATVLSGARIFRQGDRSTNIKGRQLPTTSRWRSTMLIIGFQTTEQQRKVVQSFNSLIFNRGELENTLRKNIWALFTANEQDAVAFIEQVLKEGKFATKSQKQEFKRRCQAAVGALYNKRKGLDIHRNSVTFREVKADETINDKGAIVEQKRTAGQAHRTAGR